MAVVLIGFAAIALKDLIPLVRQRSKRGILAFLLLFLPALALSVLQAAGIEVPSFMALLGSAVKAMGLSY